MPNTVKTHFVREFLVWQRLTFRCVAWILNLRNISQVSDEILVQAYSAPLLFFLGIFKSQLSPFFHRFIFFYHFSGFGEASVLTLHVPPSAAFRKWRERLSNLPEDEHALPLTSSLCSPGHPPCTAAVIVSLFHPCKLWALSTARASR